MTCGFLMLAWTLVETMYKSSRAVLDYRQLFDTDDLRFFDDGLDVGKNYIYKLSGGLGLSALY